jgi:hypothetical protein
MGYSPAFWQAVGTPSPIGGANNWTAPVSQGTRLRRLTADFIHDGHAVPSSARKSFSRVGKVGAHGRNGRTSSVLTGQRRVAPAGLRKRMVEQRRIG